MYKIIRNVSIRGASKFYNPINIDPRFKYDDIPEGNLRRLINNKLSRTEIIPTIINGKKYYTGHEHGNDNDNIISHASPLNKNKICYQAHIAQNHVFKNHLESESFNTARIHWNNIGLEKRIEIFENIANQIESNKNGYKDDLLTDTIVGQGKSLYESEIDSVCELIDFLKFNNSYAEEIMNREYICTINELNFSEIIGLNGFVAAITPFNFTAIGANLVSAPLLMGTPVAWKPSEYALLSNYTFYKILLENNIPPEIVSFTPMKPDNFMDVISNQRNLAGIAFTGSSKVFNGIYKKIGMNLGSGTYLNYPRIVGETGGKNFHFIHPSADPIYAAEQTFHAAFGYSGQKCSACSRLYMPKHLWHNFIIKIESLIDDLYKKKYHNSGLIHKYSYQKIAILLNQLRKDGRVDIISGGSCDNVDYYHVQPTIVMSDAINHDIFNDEYFAPILSVYLYDNDKLDETFEHCLNNGGNYALTGAIFSTDDKFNHKCYQKMRFKAGNFYINDKCTGAVVGRQPFGGMANSGTNDKAGDIGFLYRFMNQRSIKHTFIL